MFTKIHALFLAALFVVSTVSTKYTFAGSEVKSNLDSVTVYLQGAEIFRSVKVDLKKGNNLIEIGGLPMIINENSIQMNAVVGASLQGIKFEKVHLEYIENSPQRKSINEQVKSKEDELKICEAKIQALDDQQNVLKSNFLLVNEENGVESSSLMQGARFFNQQYSNLLSEQLKFEKQRKQLKKELADLKGELNALSKKRQNDYGKILISIRSENKQSSKISFSYYFRRAGWYPIYDFFGMVEKNSLEVVYKADVYQSTRENWVKTPLKLSTNNPNYSGEKPYLTTWVADNYGKQKYVEEDSQVQYHAVEGYITTHENSAPLKQAKVSLFNGEDFLESTFTDSTGYYRFSSLEPATYSLKVDYAGRLPQQTTVNLHYQNQTWNPTLPFDYQTTYWATNIDKALQELTSYKEDQDKILDNIRQNTPAKKYRQQYQKSDSYGVVSGEAGYAMQGDMAGAEEQAKRSAYSLSGVKQPSPVYKPVSNQGTLIKNTLQQVEYQIKEPATIYSDGKDYSIDIQKVQLSVNYGYSASPKIVQSAFLFVTIPNWHLYNLRPGEVNIYLDNKYVGKTEIDNTQDDSLTVGLGRDDQINIDRKAVSKETNKRFLGGKMIEEMQYEIDIRNNRSGNISLKVTDQIPVSQKKEVEVTLLDKGTASLEEATGKLTWTLSLKPGETKKLKYSYKVSYPKFMQLYIY